MGGSVKKVVKYANPMTAVNNYLLKKTTGTSITDAIDSVGSSGSSSAGTNSYGEALAKIALESYNQGAPLRQAFLSQGQSVLDGSFNPQTSATYAPLYNTARSGIESQYGVAKDNIMANTASGGALTGALADLEMARAGDVGSLSSTISSDIINNILSNAYNAGFGTSGTALSALSSASSGQNASNLMAQQAKYAQENALYSGLGNIGGNLIGSTLFGK